MEVALVVLLSLSLLWSGLLTLRLYRMGKDLSCLEGWNCHQEHRIESLSRSSHMRGMHVARSLHCMRRKVGGLMARMDLIEGNRSQGGPLGVYNAAMEAAARSGADFIHS